MYVPIYNCLAALYSGYNSPKTPHCKQDDFQGFSIDTTPRFFPKIFSPDVRACSAPLDVFV